MANYPSLSLDAGNKWIKSLTQNRLDYFTGGHYAGHNLSSALYKVNRDDLVRLKSWSAPGLTKPSYAEAMAHIDEFKPAKKGDRYGPSWSNHWFVVEIELPAEYRDEERVQLEFDPDCEAMVFAAEDDVRGIPAGTPLQGITGGGARERRVDYIIPPAAWAKGAHTVVIEVTCNGMFGVPWNGDTIEPPDMNRYFSLNAADLVVPNQDAWRLLWDFEALKQLVQTLPGNTTAQNDALTAANAIINIFDRARMGTHEDLATVIADARHLARTTMFGGINVDDPEELHIPSANSPPPVPHRPPPPGSIWPIGNCHIDTAWLWPYSATQQKVARSWSTQIDLAERYPEHRFVASQAQQWKWCEELYPTLFERIREKVKEHSFLPIGGAWVEHDGNMPSGEAMVRQVVVGQRYFASRLGAYCETAWLPDTFGLSGQLPQILRSAGMKWFFTQKLSWNNINTFPHTTFNWAGIDGTRVLCHMTPVDTYTAQATVGDVNKGIRGHKNIESSNQSLLAFGNGDGGGGPLNKMLENLRRINALARTHRDVPQLVTVSTRHDKDFFFRELAERSKGSVYLPTWLGELYLEFHRGTYTSHASIKRGNRHSEILMRDVEFFATLASLKKVISQSGSSYTSSQGSAYEYPKESLDRCWEKVLLNQFHDVLPGSAIGMVYDDAEKLYAEVTSDGKQMLEDALSVLLPGSKAAGGGIGGIGGGVGGIGGGIGGIGVAETGSKGAGYLVALNTTPFPRREVVRVPAGMGGGKGAQRVTEEDAPKDGYSPKYVSEEYTLVDVVASGAALVGAAPRLERIMPASVYSNGSDHFVLRNESVQLTIADGRITSLVDVQLGRELIPPGATGGLVMFDDRPNYWDAWDVEIHHLEAPIPLKFESVRISSRGPIRAAVVATTKYDNSEIEVEISLDAVPATTKADSRSFFRFDARVDWRQRHEFLKFELPLTIRSDVATYETQFGFVQRPTHKNTTWDMAKFEVCGHKYADLSEFGYGVAILSESKYGFSCTGSLMRISLLRSPTAPDAEQDQGKHSFSWAVMPHKGHFIQSDVPMAGFLFNSPLYLRHIEPNFKVLDLKPASSPFVVENATNVFLETVKRGEDDAFKSSSKGPTTVILRLYEAFGGHASAVLRIADALPVSAAFETNSLEEEAHKESRTLDIVRGARGGVELKLDFRGFEFKTVKLVLEGVGVGEAARPKE
ncbi:glycoside hydrolase family 38 protein [Schizophyllum amplum]|uniref:Alpha-mannosidase n=1 Tax=Schizophyllum amplum TaxID=97359 RepID=A0A550BZP9_9AGAR|nr:glycoside hydrolase family 38 protein [Auriculariopsis ampla]